MSDKVIRSETPRVKDIFELFVEQEKTVTEIAQILGTSHQAVSAVTQSDAFKSLERQYYEAVENELSVRQRTKLMKARALMYDAVEDVTNNLIAAAKDMNPAVRAASISAQKAILSSVGFGETDGSNNSNKVLIINFSPEVVAKLGESGYTLPPVLEITDSTHAARLGKSMGKGVKAAGELLESASSEPHAETDYGVPGS